MDHNDEKHIKEDHSSNSAGSPDRNGVAHNEGAAYAEKGAGVESQIAQLDPAMDKRLTRKFDMHIIPWLFGIWSVPSPTKSDVVLTITGF